MTRKVMMMTIMMMNSLLKVTNCQGYYIIYKIHHFQSLNKRGDTNYTHCFLSAWRNRLLSAYEIIDEFHKNLRQRVNMRSLISLSLSLPLSLFLKPIFKRVFSQFFFTSNQTLSQPMILVPSPSNNVFFKDPDLQHILSSVEYD